MDDNVLFSHPVVAEPLSSSDFVDGPVDTSIFSDCRERAGPGRTADVGLRIGRLIGVVVRKDLWASRNEFLAGPQVGVA